MGSIDVPSYSKKANCIQYLFCRPFIAGFYSFVMVFAYILYGFILGFMGFINCFTVVCTQKYSEGYYDMYVRILEWNAKFGMYAAGLTKESPEFCP
jgi:hypothetical protein